MSYGRGSICTSTRDICKISSPDDRRKKMLHRAEDKKSSVSFVSRLLLPGATWTRMFPVFQATCRLAFQPPQKMLESVRRTSNSQAPVAAQAVFFFRLFQQRSEDVVAEVRRRDDKAPPLLSHIHRETPRGNIVRWTRPRVLLAVGVSLYHALVAARAV